MTKNPLWLSLAPFALALALVAAACNGQGAQELPSDGDPLAEDNTQTPPLDPLPSLPDPDSGTTDPDAGITNPDPQAPVDGGAAPDAGVAADAGINAEPCPANFANCTVFTDLTAENAQRRVTFGGDLGPAYAPKCLKIRAGQTLQFRGEMGAKFADYPLEQACGAAPVISRQAGQGQAQFTFPDAGLYGFHSPQHADAGMSGLIQVVP